MMNESQATSSFLRSSFIIPHSSFPRHFLVGTTADQLVGAAQGQGSNCGCGIHAAGGRPNATVENEQVGDVMCPAPGVDDGTPRINAHLGGAQEMPAGFADERCDDRFIGAGG